MKVATSVPITSHGDRATDSGTVHIRSLTGIRFVAASWVVLFHYQPEFLRLFEGFNLVYLPISLGHQAVPLFFMLSGFILSHTYFERWSLRTHADFVWLRFARLWPVHLVSICVLVSIVLAMDFRRGYALSTEAYSFQSLPAELSMTRAWYSDAMVWNFPAWSIHAEWFAYIFLFPLASVAFRNQKSSLTLLCSILALLTFQALAAAHLVVIPGHWVDIFGLFLAGSALYRLRVLHPTLRGGRLVTCGIACVCLAIAAPANANTLIFYIAFALIILGLSYESGFIARSLSLRPVVYLGTISYSLYMTHEVLHKLISMFWRFLPFDTVFSRFAILIMLVSSMIVTAALCHHLVERPCNRLLRQGLNRRDRILLADFRA